MRFLLPLLAACHADAGVTLAPTPVDELRALGQQGLATLLADPHPDDPAWLDRVDAVAAQEDAVSSGLYWYTDRDEAVRQASALGRPVLSLRLLGELTDPFSCANSRFFRAVLYAEPAVADVLRERFVLHWSSERPVPRITIDMGDGRTLESTITGNSAHYVLDTRGHPLDVLPGLYTPEDFLAELDRSLALFDRVEAAPDQRAATMRSHHQAELQAALSRLSLGDRDPREAVLQATFFDASPSRPHTMVPAERALPMALGKMRVEQPIAQAFLRQRAPTTALHPFDLRIDVEPTLSPRLEARIRRDQPAGGDAVVTRFARTLQRDSVWNRDVLHTRIRYDLGVRTDRDFDALNAWVYTYVFGTPAQDVWLGLHDPTVYAALPDAGVHDRRGGQRKRIP